MAIFDKTRVIKLDRYGKLISYCSLPLYKEKWDITFVFTEMPGILKENKEQGIGGN